MTLARVDLITEYLTQPHRKSVVVVDSGLLMSWVYAYSHLLVKNITPEEWELFSNVYDRCAVPLIRETLVIRLKYSVPTLLNRIQKRGRGYELEFYTPEYLTQIEQGISALYRKLKNAGTPILNITEKEIVDFENHLPSKAQFISMTDQFYTKHSQELK